METLTPQATAIKVHRFEDGPPRNFEECKEAIVPVNEVLSQIGGKWTMYIIIALGHGPLRFSELKRKIDGVSQKMLTQTLRKMERDGLVRRRVTAAVPVRVDYELTDLGHDLLPLQRAIKAWAEAHIDEVQQARSGYDAMMTAPGSG